MIQGHQIFIEPVLAEKSGRLLSTDPKGGKEVMPWLMIQTGGSVQDRGKRIFLPAFHKIAAVIDRYQYKTQRHYRVLYRVLDQRLRTT